MTYANLTSAVTNITNTSSIVGLTQGINDFMSGGIGISIWAMLVIVVFASLIVAITLAIAVISALRGIGKL